MTSGHSLDGGSTHAFRRRPEPPKEIKAPVESWTPDAGEVDELRSALAAIPNDDYHLWIEVGQALHSTGHEEALALWHVWSAEEYGGYSPEEVDAKWAGFRERAPGEGVGLGTIFHRAQEAGWERPAPPKPSAAEDFADLPGKPSKIPDHAARPMTPRALNARYAYVAIGAGVVADTSSIDSLDLMSTSAFAGYHNYASVEVGEKSVPLGRYWLTLYPDRRSFQRIDFHPPGAPDPRPEVLNLWRGWPFDRESGPHDLFLAHVRENLCAGDDALYRWVVAWMAHLVQHPAEKPGTAIVMRGAEGTGKGVFGRVLLELCGRHGFHALHPGHLTGNFNKHLVGKLVIFADEVTWGGRKQEEGVLKGLITEPTTAIEPKGIDAFQARSYCRIVVSSNNEWVVPAGRTARRFLVLDVGERRMGDRAYFGALLRQLEGGGYGGLMGYLAGLDLSEWPDPRAVIATAGLLDQKVESFDSVNRWLHAMLDRGSVDPLLGWPTGKFPTRALHESYLEEAQEAGIQRRTAEMLVMGRLQKVFGKWTPLGGPKDGGWKGIRRGKMDANGQRVNAVSLPPLDLARRLFDDHVGQVEWTEDDDEDALG